MSKRALQTTVPSQTNVDKKPVNNNFDIKKTIQITTIFGSVLSGLLLLFVLVKYGKMHKRVKNCFKNSHNKVAAVYGTVDDEG